MSDSVLTDWATWLESEDVGATRGVTVFTGRLPQIDGAAIALLLYSSGRPAFTMPGDGDDAYLPALERPALQLFVKHTNYDEGFALIRALYKATLRLCNVVVGDTRFVAMVPVQSPFYVGDNEEGLPMFSVNFEGEVCGA